MTVIDLRRRLSANMKKYRKIQGLTQEALAEKTGISAQTINDTEGCRHWPREENLLKIAEVLQIDVERLFKGEGGANRDLNAAFSEILAVMRKYG